jgi:peptidyl-tRNA hydrolase
MTHVLYILMRNDITSMNPGKAMAQASHASNAFIHQTDAYIRSFIKRDVMIEDLNRYVNEWQNETGYGFGTVLVLEGRMSEFKPIIRTFKALDYMADVITDPTYPILDGEVVHHVNLETCAYVFVPNKETDDTASMLLRRFPLHK